MGEAPRNKVAVVDDDCAVLDSFRFMLEVAGFHVDAYGSAQAFLASDLSYTRCLILDQYMPRMTGLEMVAQLRANGIALPTILVTSAPSPEIIARAAALGIERVIEKPPTEDDVLAFVAARI